MAKHGALRLAALLSGLYLVSAVEASDDYTHAHWNIRYGQSGELLKRLRKQEFQNELSKSPYTLLRLSKLACEGAHKLCFDDPLETFESAIVLLDITLEGIDKRERNATLWTAAGFAQLMLARSSRKLPNASDLEEIEAVIQGSERKQENYPQR